MLDEPTIRGVTRTLVVRVRIAGSHHIEGPAFERKEWEAGIAITINELSPMAQLSMPPPSIASSVVPVRVVRSHRIQGQKSKEGREMPEMR